MTAAIAFMSVSSSSSQTMVLDVAVRRSSLQPYIDFAASQEGSTDPSTSTALMLWAEQAVASSTSSYSSSSASHHHPTIPINEAMDTFTPPPSWSSAFECPIEPPTLPSGGERDGNSTGDFATGAAGAAGSAIRPHRRRRQPQSRGTNQTTTPARRLVPLPEDALRDIFGTIPKVNSSAQATAESAPGSLPGQYDPMQSHYFAERLSDDMVLSLCDNDAFRNQSFPSLTAREVPYAAAERSGEILGPFGGVEGVAQAATHEASFLGGDKPSWSGSIEEGATMGSIVEDMRSITLLDEKAAPPPLVETAQIRAPPGLPPLPMEQARQGLPDEFSVASSELPPRPVPLVEPRSFVVPTGIPPSPGNLARAVTFARGGPLFRNEMASHSSLQVPRPAVVVDGVVYFLLDAAVDVLCQRGGLSNGNEGNQKYLKDRDTMRPQYLATTTDPEKTRLSSQLVQQVYDRNGLFWKKCTDGSDIWTEVPFKHARSKASQALRDGRGRLQ